MPSNGTKDLPKNFSVGNFLHMKELSSSVESETCYCEACSGGEEDEADVQNVALVYCIECQVMLCRSCERAHKGIRLTRSHKLIEIADEINVETLYKSMLPRYCDRHQDKSIEVYCFKCKVAICMTCYTELHNTHKCTSVSKVDDDFHKQMACDVDNIAAGVEKCREMLESLENEKNSFNEQVTKTKTEISEKAEQLKLMIDVHKEKLMDELSSVKQKRMKEIESLREEIERQLLSMESYKKNVDEVRQKGTACDIARAVSGLHDRADELLMFDVIERTMADLGHADVTYTSSNFVIDDVNKNTGTVASQGRLIQWARWARAQGPGPPRPRGPETAHALFFIS